jgi:hypothetical protein
VDSPGSGPSAAVSPRVRRPSGRGRRPPWRSPGRMHRRGRRACRAAAWRPVGGNLAGTARAGECRHAVAAWRTARCSRGAARCEGARRGMAVPGMGRCRRVAARRVAAVPVKGRCRGAEDRCGGAWPVMARCPGAGVRPGTARFLRVAACRVAAWLVMARCPRVAAVPVMARCPPVATSGPARCGRTVARRRAAMAHPEGRLPGPRRPARGAAGRDRRPGSNRRPAAGRSRDRRGWRAVDGAPAHPIGRAAARRRAHPENPWRERILLSR